MKPCITCAWFEDHTVKGYCGRSYDCLPIDIARKSGWLMSRFYRECGKEGRFWVDDSENIIKRRLKE